MLKNLLRAYLINIFALWIISQYISGFQLAEGLKSLLIIGAGFTALHTFLRPILTLILGPINFLTFGLINLVIDTGLLYLLVLYFPQITISGWFFPGLDTPYLILPSLELNQITTTALCAIIINVIRSALAVLAG